MYLFSKKVQSAYLGEMFFLNGTFICLIVYIKDINIKDNIRISYVANPQIKSVNALSVYVGIE